jgi:maleylacetoacetate isomerase
MKLHTFWRSSAAYRVRIALALKGVEYASVAQHLGRAEQNSAAYLALNPQALVPLLEEDGFALGQSLAIIEYLDETYPDPPLLPKHPRARAEVRATALAIACDIHPLNNLRVLQYLRGPLEQDTAGVETWYRHWIATGFAGLEAAARTRAAGPYLHGETVSLADVCLVPQMYNARRFQCALDAYPTLVAVDAALRELPAFAAAVPERQADAE